MKPFGRGRKRNNMGYRWSRVGTDRKMLAWIDLTSHAGALGRGWHLATFCCDASGYGGYGCYYPYYYGCYF
jgi:hypothetical protein